MIFGIKGKNYNVDPYNVMLDIATNILQRLNTAFVLQGHICERNNGSRTAIKNI